LPLLVGWFGFPTLEAVIVNKVTSLVVVASGLVFRSAVIPWPMVSAQWRVIANLLAGSLVGAWLGAHSASRMQTRWLNTTILVLLVGLALGMISGHGWITAQSPAHFGGAAQLVAGVFAGVVIGAVAAVLGVAGGELIIPTLILLFGIDIKLAGSLSLCVSLPTMLVAFARYSRTEAFAVCRREVVFLRWMIVGSIAGAALGVQLLPYVSPDVLILMLGSILLISAIAVFRHT
jgi:hypothetical protein